MQLPEVARPRIADVPNHLRDLVADFDVRMYAVFWAVASCKCLHPAVWSQHALRLLVVHAHSISAEARLYARSANELAKERKIVRAHQRMRGGVMVIRAAVRCRGVNSEQQPNN